MPQTFLNHPPNLNDLRCSPSPRGERSVSISVPEVERGLGGEVKRERSTSRFHPFKNLPLKRMWGVRLSAPLVRLTDQPHGFSLRRSPLVILLLFALTACDLVGVSPTITPTRALSGPTLAPSPTIVIQSSDQLGNDTAGQNDPTAAALPGGANLPPVAISTTSAGTQTVSITLDDGALVSGMLYSLGTTRVPGVLLIGGAPDAWGDFPLRLQSAGFTVLLVQMRQPSTVADFRTILFSLSEVGTVNPGHIGVVGAEDGADLALQGCADNLLCDTAVLLSPVSQDALLNVIGTYNPRPLFLAASQNDAQSFPVVQALQAAATGELLVPTLDNTGRGAAMLTANPTLGDQIIQWLQKQLAS